MRTYGKYLLKLYAVLLLSLVFGGTANAEEKYIGWLHSGSMFVITSAEGANIPEAAAEEGFPLLIRLQKEFFNFGEAKAKGEDIRFSSQDGNPLAFQIEEWDAANQSASIWVRMPKIKGNARQEIKMHWGKPGASSESNGGAVFNESNGYVSVWHMGDEVRDETGTLTAKDSGTKAAPGMIGKSRYFSGKAGLNCGEKITQLSSGSNPHTTEAWFKAEVPNATIVGWGNEKAQGKVIVNFASPPHIRLDCYFSGANVAGASRLPVGEWIHVVHTCKKGDSRVYVNGALDGASNSNGSPLNIQSPARMYIGGWYNDFNFIGNIDEVCISKVVRSADWIRMQYENQKPMQTLVGNLVQAGNKFGVSAPEIVVSEGKTFTVGAEAGGAQKVYWLLKDGENEKIVASDRLSYEFKAGRVSADKALTLRLKAIFANEIKTKDIPVSIKHTVPDPVLSLKAPATWDGRSKIEVVAQVENEKEMNDAGGEPLKYSWELSDIAVTKKIEGGKLILTRAQNSGKLVVTLSAHNGGIPVRKSCDIDIKEPKQDAWVARVPARDEKPEDNQFYPRDNKNEGILYYNGSLKEAADSVFLKVYADEKIFANESKKPVEDKSYSFEVKLKPGLIKYKVEFGTKSGDKETVLNTVNNIVCGDAFIIEGQSNAVSSDWGKEEPPAFHSEWIRTYGSPSGSPVGLKLWGEAKYRAPQEKLQIGYWGMELAKRLVENQKVPICIINGAVGGTRIDMHQVNPVNREDMDTIYGRLLWRVRQAKLTHGIRGIFWHQGENDQGSDGPTGGYGYEDYQQFFFNMSAAWKEDYPNFSHYYLFQIWPKSCSMGSNGSDNRLREVQRKLSNAYSNMSVMSTLGIEPPGGCHYPPAGYVEIAKAILPLVEQYNYGVEPGKSITPPNLRRAFFVDEAKEAVALEFDQPVKWNDALVGEFYIGSEAGKVVGGATSGNVLTLKLRAKAEANEITYLDSKSWSQKKLLRGENGIAALTFCEVQIQNAGK